MAPSPRGSPTPPASPDAPPHGGQDPDSPASRTVLTQLLVAGITVTAYLLIKVGVHAIEGPGASPSRGVSWDPTAGLALAVLLLFGPWHVATVFIAAIGALVLHTQQVYGFTTLSITGATNAAVIALCVLGAERWLTKAGGFDRALSTQRAVGYLVIAGMLMPVPMALFGALLHNYRGVLSSDEVPMAAFCYWVVEVIGVLCVTPAILLAYHGKVGSLAASQRRWLPLYVEWLAEAVALAVAVWCMFFWPWGHELRPDYLVIPPLVWIVMRCGLTGGVLAVLAVNIACALCAWRTAMTPLAIMDLQTFLLVITSSTLLLGALSQSMQHSQERAALSEERYRTLFETNPQPMWVVDRRTRRFIDVNESALAQYGYTREKMLSMGLDDIESEPRLDSGSAVLAAPRPAGWSRSSGGAAEPGKPNQQFSSPQDTNIVAVRSAQTKHKRSDGTHLDVHLTSCPMTLPGMSARLMVARDISASLAADRARETAENGLRLALLRLVTLVDQSPMGVIEWDSQLRVVRWSGSAPSIFGWRAEEVLGKHPFSWKFVHEDDALLVRQAAAQLVDQRRSVRARNRNYTRSGQVIWCEWHNTVIRDENGEVKAFLSLVADVTAREEAEASVKEWKSRYEAAAHASRQLVYDVLYDTGDILWGGETRPLFGCDPAELENVTQWVERVHPEDRAHYATAKDLLDVRRDMFDLEYRVRRNDGTYVYIRDTAKFFTDAAGSTNRMVGFVSDVSERIHAQQELARRARELARSNADLERFASVASHDLREPLRMVTSFAHLLADRFKGRLDESADEMIGFMIEGTDRMQRMIEDLFTYSRAGTALPELTTVNTTQTVKRALQNLRVAAEECNATVTIEDLPVVIADDGRLLIVFQNILANALKFRKPGQAPNITVSGRREGGWCTFTISDDGIGLDNSNAIRIFEMFQRLNPRSQYAGNGIGLAVCKRIIEDMGGTIGAQGQLGVGTKITLSLRPQVVSTPQVPPVVDA
jgi:PAS domain S-box-containing protein